MRQYFLYEKHVSFLIFLTCNMNFIVRIVEIVNIFKSQLQTMVWGGYSGYFQDPDGHLWEIAWNPSWDVKESSNRFLTSNNGLRLVLNFY
jgi:hypothetical protein